MKADDYLVWFQRATSVERSENAQVAYSYITNIVLNAMAQQDIPHQFVYDDTSDTTNIVLPNSIATTISDILRDAGFLERAMPQKDVQASRELINSLLRGADLQKHWH